MLEFNGGDRVVRLRGLRVADRIEFHRTVELVRGEFSGGTNENTNGLLRQYLPKRASMAHLTQHDCNWIAAKLHRRPRKRLGHRTPEECYVP